MRAAPVPTEHEEQQALAQWLDLVVGPRAWCHVPNGGARRKVEAARMTAIGVKPGVPDILIFRRPPLRPEARGVAIELKRQRGSRTTSAQEDWLRELRDAHGWVVCVARGWDAARQWLEGLGFGQRRAR